MFSENFLLELTKLNKDAELLAEQLAEVQKSLRGIKKNQISIVGKNKKTGYVDYDKVVGFIIPELSKRGIMINTTIVPYENKPTTVTTANGPKIKFMFSGIMHYQFIKGSEVIQGFWPVYGDQFDDSSKSMGTALTYSDRFFLLKYFKLATDEDLQLDADAKKEEPIKGLHKPEEKVEVQPEVKAKPKESTKVEVDENGEVKVSANIISDMFKDIKKTDPSNYKFALSNVNEQIKKIGAKELKLLTVKQAEEIVKNVMEQIKIKKEEKVNK